MNMSISESDKRLLCFLAAFLIGVAFVFFVFRPLIAKNSEVELELREVRALEVAFNSEAGQAEDMVDKEESVKSQLGQVLSRFYPILESQEAEKMATVLMLNHNLSIQSLTVTIPERSNDIGWYQYSRSAVKEEAELTGDQIAEANAQRIFHLYGARVTCVVEGDEENMWAVIEDISANYPAISIVSTEWSYTEKPVYVEQTVQRTENTDTASQEEGESEEGEEGEDAIQEEVPIVIEVPVTVTTDRLTISLEIFMCNQ